MRFVLFAIPFVIVASGCGPDDRVSETPEDSDVASPTPTADEVTGRWTGSVEVDSTWIDVVFEVHENGTAESEPPEYREDLVPGLHQRYTWALSDDGTGPVVAFREEETGREVSGALRAEGRGVIQGESLSLVREDE